MPDVRPDCRAGCRAAPAAQEAAQQAGDADQSPDLDAVECAVTVDPTRSTTVQ